MTAACARIERSFAVHVPRTTYHASRTTRHVPQLTIGIRHSKLARVPRKNVIVIGGGVAGVCCAYYLSRDGCNVTILEKNDICSGCSHGNAGWIVPSYSVPLPAPGMMWK